MFCGNHFVSESSNDFLIEKKISSRIILQDARQLLLLAPLVKIKSYLHIKLSCVQRILYINMENVCAKFRANEVALYREVHAKYLF